MKALISSLAVFTILFSTFAHRTLAGEVEIGSKQQPSDLTVYGSIQAGGLLTGMSLRFTAKPTFGNLKSCKVFGTASDCDGKCTGNNTSTPWARYECQDPLSGAIGTCVQYMCVGKN